jgi:UDP-N-acetylmuramoyl-tripeptide--D-alanyl-D-alanine ligase
MNMKKFVQARLAIYAKRVLKREKPEIIAITGSVGKSSAKQAIGAVLATKFQIGISPKNYNTELGLPLAVLGLPSGGRSAFRWAGILARGWSRSLFGMKEFPKTLVLEMAADHPGDITYLVNIAQPSVSIVTAVGEAHAINFGSVENVAREKQVIVLRLSKEGHAVLNRDDERVWTMREKTKAQVMSYGFHEEADVRALEYTMNYAFDAEGGCGIRFKLSAGGSTIPVFLPNVLGRQAVYAALAATTVGLIKGMNLVEIADGLRKYEPPPGRTRCIPGIKHTLLIDDSYNSSPKSAKAALEILRDIPTDDSRRKFAVLGDMLELGALSVQGHEEVGRKAVECGVDFLIFVGEKMGDAAKASLAAGAPADRVFHFASTDEAGRFAQQRIKQGDVILIKGSRGMRLEAVTKELMADPLAASRLLPGDHEEWKV